MQFDNIILNGTKGIADKTPFSHLMCETLALDLPKRLLDIGCGSGIVGLYCLLNDAEFVYFNDMQQQAVELTLDNLKRYSFQKTHYQLTQTPFQDLNLKQCEVDAIAFNPPQLPTDLVDIKHYPENGERIFRDGGATGRYLIDLYINWLAENLPEGTKAYLGMSSILMIDELIEHAAKLGLLTVKKKANKVPLRDIFNTAILKMSALELNQREISELSGKYYKKIYGLQFSRF